MRAKTQTRGIPLAIAKLVASIDQEVYLRCALADCLGLSESALRRMASKAPELGPSFKVAFGKRWLYLYSPADVAALRAHIEANAPRAAGRPGLRTGPPTLWSTAERAERQHRQCRARYLQRKGQENAKAGLAEVAADYQRKSEQIRAGLRAEHAQRRVEKARPRPTGEVG